MGCGMGPCAEIEETKHSEAVSTISDLLSDIYYAVRSNTKKVDDQEKIMFTLYKFLGDKKDLKAMAKFLLDIKGKIEINKIDGQKKKVDGDEESEIDLDVFTDLTGGKKDDGENEKED